MSNNMSNNSFTLTERFNLNNANKLLQLGLLDDEKKASLKKYIKYSNNGKVVVRYTINEIGRLTIRIDSIKIDKQGNPKDTCRCQYNMNRITKGSICNTIYDDLDVVNCHPVLLQQIFEKKGYNTKTLSKLITKRDIIFNDFKRKGIDRDSCKSLFMAIFYGGSPEKWMRDNNIPEIPKLFYKLEKEMIENRDKLLLEDGMVKYIMEAENRKGQNGFNLKGSALSYYIQTEECKVLLCMYNWLQENNYVVGALIHDGLHIEKLKDEWSQDYVKRMLEEHIEGKTEYKLQLKIKPFDVPEEIDEMITIESDSEGGQLVSDKLKNDYIKCNGRDFMKIDNVWITREKDIKDELKNIIARLNIFMDDEGALRPYSTMAAGNSNILKFVNPTEDESFLDKLFNSNFRKLCFNNGYWDFLSNTLKPYDTETYTAVKIKRDYTPSTKEIRDQVYERILNPIFANDNEMRDSWLNTAARALAGEIEDKNWVVCMGERDCGKGVLVGMLEAAFGDYCRTTNGENFVFKNNIGDSAKSFSWLIPFEFKRFCLTNEITRDESNTYKMNGNILKKLASGGDVIEARLNHQDEINFQTQVRPMIFCNDLPPITPTDAKETSSIYYFPSKFVDDERVGTTVRNQETNEIIISYHKKDDNIKSWSKSKDVVKAFVDILFESYGERLPLPKSMADAQKDFKEAETEYTLLDELLLYKGQTYDDWDSEKDCTIPKKVGYDDVVSTKQLRYLITKKQINMSPQKYNKYLTSRGGIKCKIKRDGKAFDGWRSLKILDEE